MKPFISTFLIFVLFPNLAISASAQDKYNNCVRSCTIKWSMRPHSGTEYHIDKCSYDECEHFIQPSLLPNDAEAQKTSYVINEKETSEPLSLLNLIRFSNEDSKGKKFIEEIKNPEPVKNNYKPASCLPNSQNMRSLKFNHEHSGHELENSKLKQELELFTLNAHLLIQVSTIVLLVYLVYRFFFKKRNLIKKQAFISKGSSYTYLQV
ncbi:unnamed protein product [Blepharisma stoltei]|uniref:Uncharacterized protein n=1 Tax=Blepharisma stoltei TaxID=1481888 RepID=A0AAU9KCJ0_9CILI|nr:unnamed protein product [Blepharisma stoltei]